MLTKNFANHKILDLILVLAIILISVFVTREIMNSSGIPGLRDDWNFPFIEEQVSSLSQRSTNYWVGYPLSRNLGEFHWSIVDLFVNKLDISLSLVAYLNIVIPIAMSGILMYLFCRGKYHLHPLSSLVSGIFYMLSPLVFNSVVSGYLPLLVGYALYPLFLWLFLNIIEKKSIDIISIITGAFILRIIIGQDNNIVIASIMVTIVQVYFWLVGNESIKKISLDLVKTSALFVLALLFGASFLTTFIYSLNSNIALIQDLSISWNTFRTPLIHTAFLLDGAGYQYFFQAIPKEINLIWSFSAYVIISIVFSSVLIKNQRKNTLLYLLISLIAIFIFKGGNYPFGEINLNLLYKIPLVFGALRNSQYITFLASLSYAVLLGFVLNYLIIERKKIAKIVFPATLSLVLIYATPFWTGDFNNNFQLLTLSDEYAKTYNYLSEGTKETSVLMLPMYEPLAYKNSETAGIDVLSAHFYDRRISRIIGGSALEKLLAEKLYVSTDSAQIQSIFDQLNIEDIAYRPEFESRVLGFLEMDYHSKNKDYWNNQNILKNIHQLNPNVVPVNPIETNTIQLFKNKSYIPLIHVPKTVIVTDSEKPQDKYEQRLYATEQMPYAIIHSSELPHDFTIPDYTIPELSFNKINPVLYQVKILTQKQEFPLVFMDHYDGGWTITSGQYIEDLTNTSFVKSLKLLSNQDFSFKFENYYTTDHGNSWFIDVEKVCLEKPESCKKVNGQYELDLLIFYKPELAYQLGQYVSKYILVISAIVLMVILTIKLLNNRKNE